MEAVMRFTIQLTINNEKCSEKIEEIIQLEKTFENSNVVGMTLLESKKILKTLQDKIVSAQANEHVKSKIECLSCHKKLNLKDYHYIQYRTLFGIVNLSSPRLHNCQCHKEKTKTFSPLNQWLKEKNSPELLYIETKWASLMSYGSTAKLLQDVLPVGPTQNAQTVRNHLHNIAKRQERELEGKPRCLSGCGYEWAKLPKPDKPLTVGIDGGYVKSCQAKKTNFEIIIGKSFSKTKGAKRFGFVQTLDECPERRLLHVLKEQGMQENQQITFMSDGADNVRNLQYLMHPESEHILDWFHITMRLTVLNQFSKGLIKYSLEKGERVKEYLESTKWYLWHGNVEKALDSLEDCYCICMDEEIKYSNKKKFIKQLEELNTYIENNQHLIPNYGERWRYGEVITTSFVESTVNEVISKRMVKKQQMQWSHEGAHYIIQTRTATLNNELHEHFSKWYPGFKVKNNVQKLGVHMEKVA